MMKRTILALFAYVALISAALAQTSPNLVFGQVPTAAQWNSYFANKQDYLGSPGCPTAGCTFTGGVVFNGLATLTGGAVSGTTALNTNLPNAWIQSSGGLSNGFGTAATASSLDWRWQFTAPAPTGQELVGQNFYVDYEPSGSVDNHGSIAAGIHATLHSTSPGTLMMTAGGNFTVIRHNGGSGNPYVGVIGTGVLGIPGDGSQSVGDGVAGGVFTAQPALTEGGAFLFDQGVQGIMGSLGRAVSYASPQNNIANATDMGGAVGYVAVSGGYIERAYGGYFQTTSPTVNMALANNAYGVYIAGVAGAQNVNAALRTNAGTVIFGGNQAESGNFLGSIHATVPAKPTITLVQSGASGEFTAAGGGSYTPGGTKTYTYQVVALMPNGSNTAASTAVSTATGFDDLSVSGHNNYITWNAVEGATGGYRVYRTVAGGATTNTTGLIATVAFDIYAGQAANFSLRPTANGMAFVDSGQTGDSTTPPSGAGVVLTLDDYPSADGGGGAGAGTLKAALVTSGSGGLTVGGNVSNLFLGVNNGIQWRIDGTGKLFAQTDNAYDIGATGANRPKNLYLSGTAFLQGIASDATHTDRTVCEDTTTNQLLSGSGTAGICLGTSSLRFKHDVVPIDVGLPQVLALQPIKYKYNPGYGDPDKELYGFSAEQGERAAPELVGRDGEGKPQSFDYLGVVPMLVRAIQQQQAEIEQLRKR
jgi:hypothetical protein